METNENTISTYPEFLNKIQELDEKYNLKSFSEEFVEIYKKCGDDALSFNDMIFELKNNKKFKKYQKDFNLLKKKYNYDSYIKECADTRKSFLNERKNYMFNNIKQVKSSKKNSGLEDLIRDFVEQKFIAKWIDSIIKSNKDKSPVKIVFENTDGKIKTIFAGYQGISLDPDFVEAPLIDRVIGKSLFDTFLLRGYYDTENKCWIYIPIKFIIKLETLENESL